MYNQKFKIRHLIKLLKHSVAVQMFNLLKYLRFSCSIGVLILKEFSRLTNNIGMFKNVMFSAEESQVQSIKTSFRFLAYESHFFVRAQVLK